MISMRPRIAFRRGQHRNVDILAHLINRQRANHTGRAENTWRTCIDDRQRRDRHILGPADGLPLLTRLNTTLTRDGRHGCSRGRRRRATVHRRKISLTTRICRATTTSQVCPRTTSHPPSDGGEEGGDGGGEGGDGGGGALAGGPSRMAPSSWTMEIGYQSASAAQAEHTAPKRRLPGSSMTRMCREGIRAGSSVRSHTRKPAMSLRASVEAATLMTPPNPCRRASADRRVQAFAGTPQSDRGTKNGMEMAFARAWRDQGRSTRSN